MTTADYALIVSICSAFVAVASFVWNVWSKWLYPKANLRMTFSTVVLFEPGVPAERRPHFVQVAMTNFGPTELTVVNLAAREKRKRPWKRGRQMLVNPIHDIYRPNEPHGPFAGGLPKKIAVGENFTLYLPYNDQSVGRMELARIGVHDSFGRFHGVPRKDINKVKAELNEAFKDTPIPT